MDRQSTEGFQGRETPMMFVIMGTVLNIHTGSIQPQVNPNWAGCSWFSTLLHLELAKTQVTGYS